MYALMLPEYTDLVQNGLMQRHNWPPLQTQMVKTRNIIKWCYNNKYPVSDVIDVIHAQYGRRMTGLIPQIDMKTLPFLIYDPPQIRAEFSELKDRGLKFNHCIGMYGTEDSPYIELARQQCQKDSRIDIDYPTVVFEDDTSPGAYVLAWVHVPAPEPVVESDDDWCVLETTLIR